MSKQACAGAEKFIRARLPDAQLITLDDTGLFHEGEALLAPGDVQANIVWGSGDVLTGPHIRNFMIATLKSSQLKWFQSAAAGYDHPVFKLLLEKEDILLTSSHANAIAIAEHILGSIFSIFHDVKARIAAQAAHSWERNIFREIYGTTWLIVGYGHIGKALGERLSALGAHVIGVRRTSASQEKFAHEIHTPDKLYTLLPRADVVVISAPGGAETENMVEGRFLAAMKTEAVFINVARGTLVDEEALLKALAAGRPAMALLDVLREEPFSPESPFWDHPRVRLTPHIAGGGSKTLWRGEVEFLENLARFLKGETLVNLVARNAIPEKSLPLGI